MQQGLLDCCRWVEHLECTTCALRTVYRISWCMTFLSAHALALLTSLHVRLYCSEQYCAHLGALPVFTFSQTLVA
jgi:hypothetical protein